ncbi:hypothetical protein F5Y03DRAFT_390233 [Xylaria venustula]|nr:hypothetical protein F5Y03DRAFT_390233 [Xylaria venustula]
MPSSQIFHCTALRGKHTSVLRGFNIRALLSSNRTVAQQVEQALVVPFDPRYYTVPTPPNPQLDRLDVGNTVNIFSLPVEIYHCIFEAMDDDTIDIVCLGYTNRFFSSVVYNYFAGIWMTAYGNWAGQKIVVLSNNMDYPKGLLSSEEEERVRQKNCEFGESKTPLPDDYRDPGLLGRYKDKIYKSQVYPDRLFDRTVQSDPALTVPKGTDFFPANEKWILRNLTTKEIVRPEKVTIDRENTAGPFMLRIGFGEVVIIRTLCSETNPPGALVNTQGVWAGHRFDITTRDRHEKETCGEKWVDASSEVARELKRIYKGRFGKELSKVVKRRADTFRHQENQPFWQWVSHLHSNLLFDPRA